MRSDATLEPGAKIVARPVRPHVQFVARPYARALRGCPSRATAAPNAGSARRAARRARRSRSARRARARRGGRARPGRAGPRLRAGRRCRAASSRLEREPRSAGALHAEHVARRVPSSRSTDRRGAAAAGSGSTSDAITCIGCSGFGCAALVAVSMRCSVSSAAPTSPRSIALVRSKRPAVPRSPRY